MKRSILVIDAGTAFVIGVGGAVTAALAAGNGKLNQLSVILILLAGAMTAAKSVRSRLSMPPLENGNDEMYKRILEEIEKRSAYRDGLARTGVAAAGDGRAPGQ